MEKGGSKFQLFLPVFSFKAFSLASNFFGGNFHIYIHKFWTWYKILHAHQFEIWSKHLFWGLTSTINPGNFVIAGKVRQGVYKFCSWPARLIWININFMKKISQTWNNFRHLFWLIIFFTLLNIFKSIS